jgi:sugar lactone lactonase YvrE
VSVTGIERIGSFRSNHCEGPVWDPVRQRLLLVNSFEGYVRALDRDGEDEILLALDERVGAVAIRADGGLVVAAASGVGLADEGSDEVEWLLPLFRDEPEMCFNDAKCDPQGRLWAGSIPKERGTRQGALHRVHRNGSHAVVLPAVGLCNGLDWSPDGRELYFVDSLGADGAAGTLSRYRFDADEGTLGAGIVIATFAQGELPDGMCIDTDGCVWLAVWGAGKVQCFSSEGTLQDEIELPSPRVTSCAFGGPDMRQLFITTGRPMTPGDPHAGAVFVAEPGARGRAPSLFAGD